MDEPMTKSAWCSPSLIVLVRRETEEAVLGACKRAQNDGYSSEQGGCYYQWDCLACAINAAS